MGEGGACFWAFRVEEEAEKRPQVEKPELGYSLRYEKSKRLPLCSSTDSASETEKPLSTTSASTPETWPFP